MDARLVAVREQVLWLANVRHGRPTLAHPVAQRIPVVAVLATELLGQTAAGLTVAVRVLCRQRGGHGAGQQDRDQNDCGREVRFVS